jgi:hypothetical protein
MAHELNVRTWVPTFLTKPTNLYQFLVVQLQYLTPHSVLQAAIFAHLCEMFVGVAPCTSLFRYFFVLVKSRKTRDHIGAYYF